jgi:hypothetical protein
VRHWSFISGSGVVVVAALLALGCKKDTPAPTPTPSASASGADSPQASASAAPSPSASAVAPNGKMAHCPSAVEGAVTNISDVPGGVAIVVAGNSPDATAQIRARAQALLDASKNQTPGVHHNGNGEGGGQFGRCPIVMRNTTLDVSTVDNGSKIVVKPQTAAELDWLRRETRDRYAELQAPNAAGAGGGKMLHCPSAADGANTLVADTAGGVNVTVTGKTDAQTSDIRDRVKHLLQAAADPSPTGSHDGNGNGGGNIGRCPIVVTDTLVTAKDVSGGSVLTVKATKPNGVDGLRKETRDRLANFAAAPLPSASAAHP